MADASTPLGPQGQGSPQKIVLPPNISITSGPQGSSQPAFAAPEEQGASSEKKRSFRGLSEEEFERVARKTVTHEVDANEKKFYAVIGFVLAIIFCAVAFLSGETTFGTSLFIARAGIGLIAIGLCYALACLFLVFGIFSWATGGHRGKSFFFAAGMLAFLFLINVASIIVYLAGLAIANIGA